MRMRKEFGVQTLNKVFKRRWQYTHHAAEEKSSYQTRARCTVSPGNHRHSLFQIDLRVKGSLCLYNATKGIFFVEVVFFVLPF